MNINTELFRRTAPAKKLDIINNLTQREILNISESTVIRMVKETGHRAKGTRNYDFYISGELRKGNNWNSEVEGLWLTNGKLNINTYVQLDSTDTNKYVSWDDFFKPGDYRGTVRYEDRYGNPQTYYYTYNENDKAEILRSICLGYVNTKYKSKLTANNNK